MVQLQGADVTPTTQLVAAVSDRRAAFTGLMSKWRALSGAELTALNKTLTGAGASALTLAPASH
jgi:hypothetical protein